MNKVILLGRLVRDPELRRTQSGLPVASFTLAVDRGYKNSDGERQADFIDCVAWRNTAEFISKYFFKGQMCAVSGALQLRDWTADDGSKRRSAEVVIDNIYFAGEKKDRSEAAVSPVSAPQLPTAISLSRPYKNYEEINEDDGDLPF